MPSRDSIRRHVQGGHLPAAIAEEVARAHGLDATSISARIVDIARRARETALDAQEAHDRRGVLAAGDSELRALTALGGAGVETEHDAFMRDGVAVLARSALAVAQQHPELAELLAADLHRRDRDDLADDLLDSIPETKAVMT